MWQRIKAHPVILTLIALLVVLVVSLILGGYLLGWNWTGFGQYTSPPHSNNSDFQRAKTLWDWFQLIFIPLVLAVAGFVFNHNERKAAELRTENERLAAQERAKAEIEIALDNQRETALQDYIDKMSDLLLHEKLDKYHASSIVPIIARARTLTVLPRLDGKRKCLILQFLHESRLIKKDNKIVELSDADFREAHLSFSSLCGVDLSKANFTLANFYRSDFKFSILSFADFYRANLSEADFGAADLGEAKLLFANLTRTCLFKADLHAAFLDFAALDAADLREANLRRAHLLEVDLSYANLTQADLSNADLTNAILTNADLSNANLRDALIAPQQLDKVKSLKGATMPDGSVHL